MKVVVIGTGYVGLVTGTCLSELGNDVSCVDIDEKKINGLNQGVIPIYEPGLEEMILRNIKLGQLKFTTKLGEALEKSTVCFIAVGTPMSEDGSADLKYVKEAAHEIGQKMKNHLFVVNKSTVPVGSSELVRNMIQRELDKRNSNLSFDIISNPEFLKEGNAVADAMRPDRIVIGADNEKSFSVMKELYKGFMLHTNTFICMDPPSAEMTKYAANAMLATKISFINEIANICERVGADVNMVRLGIGSDKRIGYSFIYPGCGYGGSCFPKDVRALIKIAEKNGYETEILNAVENVNKMQKAILIRKVVDKYGDDLSELKFAVWGLAFKPETDDMREATSTVVIKALVEKGAKIAAYDPKAEKEARERYLKNIDSVEYVHSKYSALSDADALILVTEWAEFRSPDFQEMKLRMKGNVIFDGRNQYNKKTVEEYGFEYHQIGVG